MRKQIKESWPQLLFSVLFSAMIIIQRHIILDTNSCFSATLDKVSIIPYSWLDIIGYLVVMVTAYIITAAAKKAAGQAVVAGNTQRNPRKPRLWIYFCIALALVIFWLPYLLSYYPSGVYIDTNSVIQQAKGIRTLTNHHPILYTCIWKISIFLGGLFGDGQEYVVIFSVFQCVAVALVLSIFIYWLYKIGATRKTLALVFLFYAVVPLTPQYVISLWKDTLFCIVLFAYTIIILGYLYENREDDHKTNRKFIISYCVSSLLLMFLRNNGIYIVIVTSAVIAVYLLKRAQKLSVLFSVVIGIELVLTLVVQGPVYDRLGLNVDEKVESYAVPFQQVSYIVCTDGNVTEDEREFVNQIIPLETLKEVYNPLSFDQTKWNKSFNTAFFNENTSQFFRVYLSLVLKNPIKAVEEWLLETYGFWATDKTTTNGYTNISMWNGLDEFSQEDVFKRVTGIDAKALIRRRTAISYAALLWMMLFLASLIHRENSRLYIAFLPSLLGWATIMIATPCAFSFRYVYFLYQLFPVYAYMAFLSPKAKAQY